MNDANFDGEIARQKGLLIVDLWAPWCGPCRMLSPILDKYVEENAGKVAATKVNVDDAPNTAAKLDVSGIPMLVLYKDGKKIDSHVGVMTKEELAKWVDGNSK